VNSHFARRVVIFFVALVLLVLTHAEPFDFGGAIVDGGVIEVPAGVYNLSGTIRIPSDTRIIGVPGQTVFHLASDSMLLIYNVSNVSVQGVTFRADAISSMATGLRVEGARNLTVSGCRFENLFYGMKVGSGAQTTGLAFTDCVGVNCCQVLFLANLTDGTFARLDLSVDSSGSWGKNHVLYVERGCHDLSFQDCVFSGGRGQVVHCYYEGTSGGSTNISFSGLDITCGYGPIVISKNFDGVRITNLTARTTSTDYSVLQTYGASKNVTVDGFECWGGIALVGSTLAIEGVGANWRLTNGIYHGSLLVGAPERFDPYPIGSGVVLAR